MDFPVTSEGGCFFFFYSSQPMGKLPEAKNGGGKGVSWVGGRAAIPPQALLLFQDAPYLDLAPYMPDYYKPQYLLDFEDRLPSSVHGSDSLSLNSFNSVTSTNLEWDDSAIAPSSEGKGLAGWVGGQEPREPVELRGWMGLGSSLVGGTPRQAVNYTSIISSSKPHRQLGAGLRMLSNPRSPCVAGQYFEVLLSLPPWILTISVIFDRPQGTLGLNRLCPSQTEFGKALR